MIRRLALWTLAAVAVLAIAGFGAFKLSPWPSALLIRHAFDKSAIAANEALAQHVPAGVTEQLNLVYDANSPETRLDVYRPGNTAIETKLPLIVWVHGGAFISGGKDLISNYLRILASRGYVVVGVDYAIAPGSTYPTPIRQANAALSYLKSNAGKFGIDKANIFLAGDSAGSQIVGQVANVISNQDYAAQMQIMPGVFWTDLRGVILHCGAFGTEGIDLEGPFGGFLKTVLWSYFGTRDFAADPRLQEFSVAANMTPRYPPIFISAGNADPLLPQSEHLAARATLLGIPVDALFYPKDYAPPLEHEYQFNLDTDAGKLALERSLAFVAAKVR
jgi:acetyl esterase/lipase